MALPNSTWLNLPEWSLPSALTNGVLVINEARNRLWYAGGQDGTATNRAEIWTTRISGDGALIGWKLAGLLPQAMSFMGGVMTSDDWIFLLNGTVAASQGVLYAFKVNAEGQVIGTVKDVGSIDLGLSQPILAHDDKWLYVIGGNEGTVGNVVVPSGQLARVGTTVTATVAAGHQLVPGQTVTLAPGEANFAAGVKTVVTVVDATHFTYSEAGSATSSGVQETFTPVANPRVHAVRLSGDGTIGTWQRLSAAQFPQQVYASTWAIWDSYIYVVGGTSNAASDVFSGVYSARILGPGQLGPWTKVADLPIAVSRHDCVIWRDKLIVLGGQDTAGTNRSEVQVATLQPSGGIGPFSTDPSAGLPVSFRNVEAVFDGKRVWLAGGFDVATRPDVLRLRLE